MASRMPSKVSATWVVTPPAMFQVSMGAFRWAMLRAVAIAEAATGRVVLGSVKNMRNMCTSLRMVKDVRTGVGAAKVARLLGPWRFREPVNAVAIPARAADGTGIAVAGPGL